MQGPELTTEATYKTSNVLRVFQGWPNHIRKRRPTLGSPSAIYGISSNSSLFLNRIIIIYARISCGMPKLIASSLLHLALDSSFNYIGNGFIVITPCLNELTKYCIRK